VTVVVAEAPTLDHPDGGRSHRRAGLPIEGPRFAHASEAELARILDFYMVRWEYEPRTFPILWNIEGQVVESFSPDFYLPDLDLWLELTTLRQSLVRRKNRKLRRMRELYPMIRIKLLYARDFRALMLKYGRLDVAASLIGTDGQVMPGDAVTEADGSPTDVARSSSAGQIAEPVTLA
jgi:hypoxanthine phosphoribosyltransferase